MKLQCSRSFVLLFVFFSVFAPLAQATDFTSTNFILRDPVVTIEGGYSSSTNFQFFSSTGQNAIGETTSTSFTQRSGFLYFPTATTPAIAATAGNGEVSLSWSAATGSLGNVTNYRVGTATVSGGPYTYESVGNVLTFTKTGLTNGTTYYFVVQAQAATETVATSAQVSATPAAPAPSGGGGSAVIATSAPSGASVMLSGWAYPLSNVVVLKDAQVAMRTIAGPDAKFTVAVSGLSAGTYTFSAYAEDNIGRRSQLFNFSIFATQNASTQIGGIFIAPSIATDKVHVRAGDDIAIFGQSVPNGEITIAVNSPEEIFVKTASDGNGAYLYNFDTAQLTTGEHFTKSKARLNGEVSPFGVAVRFGVGKENISSVAAPCPKTADLNNDCKVNLIDFSIAAYWYKRELSTAFAELEKTRLNGDGKIDLVDFSIMAFYWTG